jgi:hypothetical protein
MKRLVISLVAVLCALVAAHGQSVCVVLKGEVPLEAAGVLVQRVTQILESGEFTVAEDAKDTVWVNANVVEHMTTPGSISQSVLVLDIVTAYGETEETFSVKGVGKNDEDAWLRACKQVLPRSRQAQEFIQKLKQ